jgi:hypothetical protein
MVSSLCSSYGRESDSRLSAFEELIEKALGD